MGTKQFLGEKEIYYENNRGEPCLVMNSLRHLFFRVDLLLPLIYQRTQDLLSKCVNHSEVIHSNIGKIMGPKGYSPLFDRAKVWTNTL